ncbi:nuclear transport factor 2 family protein [Nocardia sp. NPDC019395]|uniref:nuclear transport factor 2 family protein n=1 Tax=Nocardia sp. NPDC019395 TaxID=3154686 RepID=UPI0033F15144
MTTESPSEAIRSLIARLAHLADEGSVDDYAQLYTEDATWEMRGGARTGLAPRTVTGRAAIAAAARERRAAGIAGPGTGTRHVTTCISITFDSDDAARGESVWQFFAETTTAPRLSGIGRYHDIFVRVDGRWFLAERSITNG